MKQLFEFLPVILFYIVYKLYDMQTAAITLVVATVLQMLIFKLKYGKIEKKQAIMGGAIVFFGCLTAYFNDVRYLQWRVTIVYSIFATILLVAQFGFKTPLIQKLLGKEIHLPDSMWHKLNLGWAILFILCVILNIYISQNLSEEIWVNFKSFGILCMMLVGVVLSGIYMYPYLAKQKKEEN
ncbi:MAG: septation protein A [Lonepinella koalarum]|nr:septation protein A [Lonepinella koalarum]